MKKITTRTGDVGENLKKGMMTKIKTVVVNAIGVIRRNIVMKMMLKKLKMRMTLRMQISVRNGGGTRRSTGEMTQRNGRRSAANTNCIERNDFYLSLLNYLHLVEVRVSGVMMKLS